MFFPPIYIELRFAEIWEEARSEGNLGFQNNM